MDMADEMNDVAAESVSGEGENFDPAVLANFTDDEMVEDARSKVSDSEMSVDGPKESLLQSTPKPTPASSNESVEKDSKRKFRLMGLRFPGDWKRNEKVLDLMNRAEQFHMWFDPKKDNVTFKTGGVSLTFDSIESARAAFVEAQKIVVDGVTLKPLASKSFYDPLYRKLSRQFSVMEDDSMSSRAVYVLHLPAPQDLTLMKSILGEDIEKLTFLPQNDKKHQAEVVMSCVEAAKSAKEDADGFELTGSVLKVLTSSGYHDWVAQSARPQPFTPSSHPSSQTIHSPSSTHPSSTPRTVSGSDELLSPTRFAPSLHKHNAPNPISSPILEEPEESTVISAMEEIVKEDKINWAEYLNSDKKLLYEIVDKVSARFGGLRDALLRECFLSVLESALREATPNSWMRMHLDDLIKMWKKEMTGDVLYERPTRVPLQARNIAPIPREKKGRRKRHPDSKVHFGIGSVLAAAKIKFGTEEGELDVEDDDSGNILIGGKPLSFDSWATFSRSQPVKRAPAGMDSTQILNEKVDEKRENRKAKRAKMEEEKKKKKAEVKPAKELEEGEMESDDDNNRRQPSSNSTSTSSSDSDDDHVGSRRRRRFRKKAQANTAPTLPPLYQSIYENRVAIIGQLSADHRIAFSKVLSQIVNQNGDFSASQQQNMMTYMMTNFIGSQSSSR